MVKQKHPHYDQSYYRKFDGINFRLVAVRKKKTGHRYYNIDDIKSYMKNNS